MSPRRIVPIMPPVKEGDRFGRLVIRVIAEDSFGDGGYLAYADCEGCGRKRVAFRTNSIRRRVSCGCAAQMLECGVVPCSRFVDAQGGFGLCSRHTARAKALAEKED